MTRYKAVLFDLFGTIADFPVRHFNEILSSIAEMVGAPWSQFFPVWVEHYGQHESGGIDSIEDMVADAGRAMGLAVGVEQISRAACEWRAFQRRILVPRPDALATIDRVRTLGCKTGLISNAPADVPRIWEETPFATRFDVAIFSCVVRLRKPDPAIYELATTELGVLPEQCLFIGDGGSSELSAAQRIGMHAIQIRDPFEDPETDRWLHREIWTGASIARISDLLPLVAHRD